jgi:hypothetical protein
VQSVFVPLTIPGTASRVSFTGGFKYSKWNHVNEGTYIDPRTTVCLSVFCLGVSDQKTGDGQVVSGSVTIPY